MKNILFILSIFAFCSPIFSQGDLRLEAKFSPGEGMLLKITPSDFPLFFSGLENGYSVERQGNGNFEMLSENLRPAALDMQSSPGYRPTGTEIMAMQIWHRRDTVRQAISDPKNLEGLNLGLGMYLVSAISTPEDARRSGLVFVDKTAVLGNTYTYRVSMNGQAATSVSLRAVAQTKPMPPVPQMDGVGQDSSAAIRWPHNPQSAVFLGYFLEKSEDGQTFSILNETPIFYNPKAAEGENNPLEPNMIYHKDLLAQNDRRYFYRLIGVDAFGDRMPGRQVLEITGVDLIPPSAPTGFSIEKNELEGTVVLTWEKSEREADLIGFHIYRSNFPDSGFVRANPQILGAAAKRFSEKMPQPEDGKFYRIGAVDVAGNESFSPAEFAVFYDKTPPAVPLGLAAKIDSNGIVNLSWQPNREADFHGYLLTASRFEEGEFTPVSQKPLRVNSFTDSLALDIENHYYFYQLAAVDKMFNVSGFTEKIRVTLPDTIAPTAPLLQAISIEDGIPILEWLTGEEVDLAAVRIFRKEDEKEGWAELATVTVVDITSWADGVLPAGRKYSYRLQAVDEVGNVSNFSNLRTISIRQREEVAPVSKLSYSTEKQEAIRLDWQVPADGGAVNFLIYKMENDGAPQLLDMAQEANYTDQNVRPGNAYAYFVVAQAESGKRSKMSEVLEVKF